MTVNMPWKIVAAVAALAFAPMVSALPAAADTDAPAKNATQATQHREPARVRSSYAHAQSAPAFEIGDGRHDELHHPYHCGIGLMNTPLPCESDH